jgi:hypothetical protein
MNVICPTRSRLSRFLSASISPTPHKNNSKTHLENCTAPLGHLKHAFSTNHRPGSLFPRRNVTGSEICDKSHFRNYRDSRPDTNKAYQCRLFTAVCLLVCSLFFRISAGEKGSKPGDLCGFVLRSLVERTDSLLGVFCKLFFLQLLLDPF